MEAATNYWRTIITQSFGNASLVAGLPDERSFWHFCTLQGDAYLARQETSLDFALRNCAWFQDRGVVRDGDSRWDSHLKNAIRMYLYRMSITATHQATYDFGLKLIKDLTILVASEVMSGSQHSLDPCAKA